MTRARRRLVDPFTLGLWLLVARPAAAAGHGLEVFPDPQLLLVLLAVFTLLVPLTDRVLFRPLFRALDERGERIEGARRRAAELATEVGALLERHRRAVAEERARAEQERRSLIEQSRQEQAAALAAARVESEEQLERARAELAGALERARVELRREAQGLARELAEALLGRRLA